MMLRTPFRIRRLVIALAAVAAAVPVAGGAASAPPALSAPPNAVVALQGTPHLWVADANGALHAATDTRAIADKPIDWGTRITATVADLKGATIGAPYLSTALVKVGEPIFLPKWETNASVPVLLHIQSIDDLMLLGVSAAVYGQTVLTQSEWEQRFGFKVADLQRGELAPIAGPPPTAATSPAGGTGTASSVPGSLGHFPSFGADVSFTLPADRGWSESSGVRNIQYALPPLTITGEQIINQQRTLDNPRGAFVYVITSAVPLDMHPEIKTAADLASAASAQGTRYPVTGYASTTVDAGVPAVMQDFKLNVTFETSSDHDVHTYDVLYDPNAGESEEQAKDADWYGHSVFAIRGNYGYQFRLLTVDSNARNSRVPDLERALATLTFGY